MLYLTMNGVAPIKIPFNVNLGWVVTLPIAALTMPLSNQRNRMQQKWFYYSIQCVQMAKLFALYLTI